MFIFYDVYKLYGYYTFLMTVRNFFKSDTYILEEADRYFINGTKQTKLAFMVCKGLLGDGYIAKRAVRYLITNSRRINYKLRSKFLLYALDNKTDIYKVDDFFISNFDEISYQGAKVLFDEQKYFLDRIKDKILAAGYHANPALYTKVAGITYHVEAKE